MEKITTNWNRDNLDRINQNFGMFDDAIKGVENTIGKIDDQVNNAVEKGKKESREEIELMQFLSGGLNYRYQFESNNNLFNPNGDFWHGRSFGQGGRFLKIASYSTHTAIPIKSNETYQATGKFFANQYDKNGNFLEYNVVEYKTPLLTHKEAAFIGISIKTDSIPRFMLANTDKVLTGKDYKAFTPSLVNCEIQEIVAARKKFKNLKDRLDALDSNDLEIVEARKDFNKLGDRLDSLENKTTIYFRNIIKNGNFIHNLDDWEIKAGTPKIEEKDGIYKVNVDSSGVSSQLSKMKVKLQTGNKFYISFKASCSSHTKGEIGVIMFEDGKNQLYKVSIKDVTDGAVSKSGYFELKKEGLFNFYVGAANSANLKGYIWDIILIDLTEVFGKGNEPDKTLFDKYMAKHDYEFIDEIGVSGVDKLEQFKDDLLNDTKTIITDEEAEKAFIEEMNKKCQYLGMSNTVFINSHGLHVDGQITSTRDILLLSFHALNKNNLLEAWGRKSYTFDIEGDNKRTSTIKTTVTNPDLEKDYIVLGGKTGTLTTGGDAYNVTALIQSKKTGDIMLGTTLGASGKDATFKRFIALKQLADWAIEQKKNPDFKPSEDYVSDGGSILFVPSHNPTYFNNYQPVSDYAVNEDKKIRQASLTKVMTAILTVENVPNLNETFSFKQSDIVGGSGPKMYEGDIISYYDALHLMLMPSSNNTAKAMARVVGRKLIETRGYN